MPSSPSRVYASPTKPDSSHASTLAFADRPVTRFTASERDSIRRDIAALTKSNDDLRHRVAVARRAAVLHALTGVLGTAAAVRLAHGRDAAADSDAAAHVQGGGTSDAAADAPVDWLPSVGSDPHATNTWGHTAEADRGDDRRLEAKLLVDQLKNAAAASSASSGGSGSTNAGWASSPQNPTALLARWEELVDLRLRGDGVVRALDHLGREMETLKALERQLEEGVSSTTAVANADGMADDDVTPNRGTSA
jgi:hypothetical protein